MSDIAEPANVVFVFVCVSVSGARARVSFIYFWVPCTRPRAGWAGKQKLRNWPSWWRLKKSLRKNEQNERPATCPTASAEPFYAPGSAHTQSHATHASHQHTGLPCSSNLREHPQKTQNTHSLPLPLGIAPASLASTLASAPTVRVS